MKSSYFLTFVVIFLVTGCSSTFKVTTQPEQASVYFVDDETSEKKLIGESPVTKKSQELREIVGSSKTPGGFAKLRIEKEGFTPKDLWVPVSSSGGLATEISVRLSEEDKEAVAEELKSAEHVLERIFLAQQFARTQQFERAFIEIDKVLEAFPSFARAHSMKGAIYFAKGELNESLKWYEQAIELDPQFTQAVEMAARVRVSLNLPPGRLPARQGVVGP